MISGKEFAEKNFSQVEEIEEKLFSTGNEELDNLLTEVYYSGIEDGYDYAQKEFSGKSKVLAAVAPGAWQAKEAAKFGYDDEDEYKKVRGKYALKGLFTPGTATVVKRKAMKMAEEGKSAEEIREFLEGKGEHKEAMKTRKIVGVAEALTGGFGGTGLAAAEIEGLANVIAEDDKRKKFKKHKKEKDFSDKEDKSGLKTAGKVALGTGAAVGLAGGVAENVIADKVVKKAAKKVGADKIGFGAGSMLTKWGPRAQEDVNRGTELIKRTLKSNKKFKLAKKADIAGTATMAVGGALLAANSIKKKKKEEKK